VARALYDRYQGLQAKPAKPLRVVVGQYGGFDAATTVYIGGRQISKIDRQSKSVVGNLTVDFLGDSEATGGLVTFRGDAIGGPHQELTRSISYDELPAQMSFEYHGDVDAGFEFYRVDSVTRRRKPMDAALDAVSAAVSAAARSAGGPGWGAVAVVATSSLVFVF
jgi:hypothetical protein